MKPIPVEKFTNRKNGYQSDDDNVRYKLNTEYFNNTAKISPAKIKKIEKVKNEDDTVRYKFPTVSNKTKPELKPKPKPKIKVNFWSNKPTVSRVNTSTEPYKLKTTRRHTMAATVDDTTSKPKPSVVKVRKRVSFLPSPIFSENHIPMVTVPDDLTIQLNEEEANDLREDLNLAFVNSGSSNKSNSPKKRSKNDNQFNTQGSKRKRSDDVEPRAQATENELEFFSKYVVQKLRRMETNQRIYSENLINTVLMLGQLGKLNGKSKIAET